MSVSPAQYRAKKRHQSKGRDGDRVRQPWTLAEMTYVTKKAGDSYVHSAGECARTLGRSVLAIERMRNKCKG